MISKKIVLVLSLCVAGSLAPVYGALACVDGADLATILTTDTGSGAGVCDIGAYTFTFKSFNIIGAAQPSNPVGGLTASDVLFNVLLNANGTGFVLTPTVPFNASAGGNVDSELQYIVQGTGINSIYLQVDGSATPNAFNHVLEQYCLGGTTLPPAGDGFCPGNQPTLNQLQLDASITNGLNTSAFDSDTFAAQTSIAVLKDIDVNGGPGGGSGDYAEITSVTQQFGPAIPEPSTIFLSVIGLGLLALGKRKFVK